MRRKDFYSEEFQAQRARRREELADLITIREAVPMTGKSLRTLQRYQNAGKMPEQKRVGRWKKYSRRELQKMFGV